MEEVRSRGRGEAGASPTAQATQIPVVGPPQRLVTRVVLEFLIDVLVASTRAHGGDLKAMIVFMAIQHANIELLETDPERAVSAFSAYPNDDLRRPITTHALAQSVSFPPETCRRFVKKLMAAGYCRQIGDRGLIVPSEVMAREPFASSIDSTHAAFVNMLNALNAIGFDVPAAAALHRGPSDLTFHLPPEPMRFALWTVMNGYIMRVLLDGIENHDHDFLRGLIFVTVMAINVEHITFDASEAWRYANVESTPPDDQRTPATVRAISNRIGIPYETTRQHLIRLVERGRAEKVSGGFIIPGTVNQDPRYLRMGLNIYWWLLRSVSQLERLGFDLAAAVA